MQTSELRSRPAKQQPSRSAVAPDVAASDNERWEELISQIGAEIAGPLTTALERVNALTSTGKIDRGGLRALREELEAARQAGMIGQQLSRFASGRVRQSHERMALADVLGGVINHRQRESAARGMALHPALQPVDVLVDASLLFSLLNTTVDWALQNAHSKIDFAIDLRLWPAVARLTCRYAHRSADPGADDAVPAMPRGLDSLQWRLIEQTAWTMGLSVERRDESHMTTLTIEFPNLPARAAPAKDLDDGFAPSVNSQPLAGSHVLVVASRREVRMQVRDALRHMSLIIDFVNTIEEATAFCREGLPHAVIVESIQVGERFAQFRQEILRDVEGVVFIEITEEGSTFETAEVNGGRMARLGRGALAASLPSALLFELSKGL